MLLIMFFSIIYLLRQTPSRVQLYLLILTFSVTLMVLGYTFEINAHNKAEALVGLKIGYFGKPFILLSSFLFLIDHYGYRSKLIRPLIILLNVITIAIIILVFTSEYHTLYYTSIAFCYNGTFFPHFILGRGVFYYIYMGLVFSYFFFDTYIVILEMKKAKTRHERARLYCVWGLIGSGILGYISYLCNFTAGYDSTIFGCFAGSIFLLILFFKYRIFDALSVVKEYALNVSENGLIVFDPDNRVIYINRKCSELFPDIITGQRSQLTDTLIEKLQPNHNYITKEKVFQISKNSITKDGRCYGTSLEFNDITDNYYYSQRLEQDVSARTKDLVRIQRKITAGFANIVEARDNETGDHVRRTSQFVRLIAENLATSSAYSSQFTPELIDMLEQTAPLHDVGKMAIPDKILLKPARLTPDEISVMQKHTVFGKELIDKTMLGVESDEYVKMAEDIAMYHHERWDGTGYPEGLKGEEIPLSARIMSIADVYDALRSKRIYKNACSRTEAVEFIRNQSGKHFDPVIANVFLYHIDEAERIVSNYNAWV